MLNQYTRWLAVSAIFLIPTLSFAEGEVVQSVAHGQIHWSDGTITATGSGAPSLKAANVAVARLGAERAAKMDAWRNILEAIKGARVQSGETVDSMMSTSPQVKSRIEGIVRNFKIIDTKYYSDGGVDVIVQMPMSGVLLNTLLPDAGSKAVEGTAAAGDVTGVVVNARGLGATPALAPRLLDEQGNVLFSAAHVSRNAALQKGIAAYAKSLDKASKDERVAGNPSIIKALKITEPGSPDLVLGPEDAAKVKALTSPLSQGKLVIVID
jgi:hypothetical protein